MVSVENRKFTRRGGWSGRTGEVECRASWGTVDFIGRFDTGVEVRGMRNPCGDWKIGLSSCHYFPSNLLFLL